MAEDQSVENEQSSGGYGGRRYVCPAKNLSVLRR